MELMDNLLFEADVNYSHKPFSGATVLVYEQTYIPTGRKSKGVVYMFEHAGSARLIARWNNSNPTVWQYRKI